MSENLKKFSWKDYLFSPQGRINRDKLWFFGIIQSIVVLPTKSMAGKAPEFFSPWMYALIAECIVFLYPSWIIIIKRLHDLDKSGWWSLFSLIPIVGPIWIFFTCGLMAGTPGSNRFGEDPLETKMFG